MPWPFRRLGHLPDARPDCVDRPRLRVLRSGLRVQRQCRTHAVWSWLGFSRWQRCVHAVRCRSVCGRVAVCGMRSMRQRALFCASSERVHWLAHVRPGRGHGPRGHIVDGSHVCSVPRRLNVVGCERRRAMCASDGLPEGRV